MNKKTKSIALIISGFLLSLALGGAWQKKGLITYRYRYFNYPPQNPAKRGDGTKATNLKLFNPMGLAEDRNGNIYIVDRGKGDLQGGMVWQVDAQGKAKAIAGTGKKGQVHTISENTKALETNLYSPETIAFDSKGRLHVVDHGNNVIWRLESDGQLTRIAGIGKPGFSGDGGLAINAAFRKPYDIKFDSQDNLYVADAINHRIRKITPDGRITTIVGSGEPGYSGDGGVAIKAQLNTPYNILIDPQDRLLIADSLNHVIRRVDSQGVITTIAGTGEAGYTGDNGNSISATFDQPQSLFIDDNNVLYIGDEHNYAVRAIYPDGKITTIIGNGKLGFTPDKTPIDKAMLSDPETIIIRQDGSMLISDAGMGKVLVVGNNELNQSGRQTVFVRDSISNNSVRVFAGRDWQCQSSDYKKLYKFSHYLGSTTLICQP